MDKTKVDLLITNGAILTLNEEMDILESGSLAIKENIIADIGSVEEISNKYHADNILDASDTIVMPGLIDTHFHTAQQLERGLIGYLGKDSNLKQPVWLHYLMPFEISLSDDDLYLSALFSYANLLKVGTTCFAEIGGPRPELMAPAIEKTGIRGILARSTRDLKEGPPEVQDTTSNIVAKGESLYEEWHGRANGRIRTSMSMQSITLCSRKTIEAIKETADKLGIGIQAHLAESAPEIKYAIDNFGLRPVEYMESIGFLGPNLIAAHSARMNDAELEMYKQSKVSVAHCPASSFPYMGFARVPEMLEMGINVGLGTDGSFPSGGSLDLFRLIGIAYYGHGIYHGQPFHEKAPIFKTDLLRMATLGGAKTLSWNNEIGSLEKGKKADMILLSRGDLDTLPSYEIMFTAASNASAAQVKTVLVDGKVVVRDRKLTLIDEEELKAKIKERTPKIVDRFLEKIK